MKGINLLFDARIFKLGLVKGSSRTGIYFTAKNILDKMCVLNDFNLFFYLPKADKSFKKDIFLSLNLKEKDIPLYDETTDLSHINVFFSPFEKAPDFIRDYPSVSCYQVLYDIIPLLFPEYFDSALKEGWFKELITSLNNKDNYFAISDYTKNDFLKYFDVLSPDKITTIPLATNIPYQIKRDKSSLDKIKKKYKLGTNDYIFSLCSLEPRKNLIRSVRAFITFIKKHNIRDLNYVLGGAVWQGFETAFEKGIPDYALYKDKIIITGYVDDEDLNTLYSNAKWFVYTSLYEGFGMPPLEAMSAGTAVVTSDNSSLPEVVKDCAVQVDALSDEAHIKAYETYYFDEAYRLLKAHQGLKRSALFSWQKTVQIIADQIKSVEIKKSRQPLVSIITPTYNLIKEGRKEWFIQNIQSVQNQTYQNIEHIVIDGGSTDGTLELLNAYAKSGLITYHSEPDKGIYDALNKGILKAKGKYVVCLNSDDYYLDTKAVELEVMRLEEAEADACYANTKCIDGVTGKELSHWRGVDTFYPPFGEIPNHQTFMIKKSVMQELLLYNLNYQVSADSHFIYKMVASNKKFVFLDKEIVVYRFGGYSGQHPEIVFQNQEDAFYEVFAKKLALTRADIMLLAHNKFISLPFEKAVTLCLKLKNKEWQKEFLRRWQMGNQISVQPPVVSEPIPLTKPVQLKKIKFNLLNIIPLLKVIRKGLKMKYLLFGFIPLFGYKIHGPKREYKLFGLPLFKMRRIHYGRTQKYYLFNIPILKISKKEA